MDDSNTQAYMVQVYLPAKTKDGEPVSNHAAKVSIIEDYMVKLTGGSTRVTEAKGAWADDDGDTVYEDVQLIRTLVVEKDISIVRAIARLLARKVKEEFTQDTVLYHITEVKNYAFV
ncbi:hypothetical protein LCGC14_2947730 [marine sediment metagenome]|uniref:Uncharacterized protein n=1 Tax=marine sediment metagenome TaxID=412755 RepID=A0A0F8ZNW5_9ZZZZ